jgi:hypothetical protein
MPEKTGRVKRLWDNEPAAIAGAFIAITALAKALLRWGGIEVPAEVDTTMQVVVAAWVGLFVRSKSTPVDGPQNTAVRDAATRADRASR